jgi:hypothetical protein
MPTYEFKKTGAMRTANVDGNELVFSGGTATRSLLAGEYRIHWFARGDNGDAFSLTVGLRNAKPVKEKKDAIGPTRKASGILKLKV